jgi:hypothetical protein
MNIRMKVQAANRVISQQGLGDSMRLDGERGMYKRLLCLKLEGSSFHHPHCVDGTCSSYCNLEQTIQQHCGSLLQVLYFLNTVSTFILSILNHTFIKYHAIWLFYKVLFCVGRPIPV